MSFESVSYTANPLTSDVPVGRFAPSPSGPLHFGSLLSALASFLDIRSKNGRWLLRIDDLDTPRTIAGSEAAIIESLKAHGLHWDEPVSWQSRHLEDYRKALLSLASRDLLFFCNCSRRSLRDQDVYPGTCRNNVASSERLDAYLNESGERNHAVRIRVPDATDTSATVHDELQIRHDAEQAKGDYVVFRRDGLVSYQLAVVVDDIITGVNRVVRGADLLPTTARQQQLHSWLGSTPPAWLHLPIVLNQRNTKLSKQAHSQPVDNRHASANLDIALQLLGQNPPAQAPRMEADALCQWAIDNWQPELLPREQSLSTFVGW